LIVQELRVPAKSSGEMDGANLSLKRIADSMVRPATIEFNDREIISTSGSSGIVRRSYSR
jgi:hypothetical protein